MDEPEPLEFNIHPKHGLDLDVFQAELIERLDPNLIVGWDTQICPGCGFASYAPVIRTEDRLLAVRAVALSAADAGWDGSSGCFEQNWPEAVELARNLLNGVQP